MKTKTFFRTLFIPAAVLLVLCSCSQMSFLQSVVHEGPHDAINIMETTYTLHDLQKAQNYWGRISTSGPHWIADTNQFNVAFSEDPASYAAAARANVAGGQTSTLETSLLASQAIQAMLTPRISTGSPPATNAANPVSPPPIPTNAAQVFAHPTFAAPGALLSSAPVPDERQVVSKAINDKIAEQMMELIANPTFNSNQEQVLFGLMQVTCQPGQRTRKGFMADLSITLSYGQNATYITKTTNCICERKKLDPPKLTTNVSFVDGQFSNKVTTINYVTNITSTTNYEYTRNLAAHPRVLAVLPLIDSENLQLQRSDRSQVELAQSLAVAFAAKGLNAAANTLADYVRRQQSDVGTRNSLPIATTYATGSTFGFQLYPSLQAIEKPGKTDSKSGNILQPMTFPAVVAIAVDKTDLEGGDSSGDDVSKSPWKLLVADTRTRWVPLRRPVWYGLLAHYPGYGNAFASTASISEDIYQAGELDFAEQRLRLLRDDREKYPNQYTALQAAFDELKSTSVSDCTAENLPQDMFKAGDTNSPVISDVLPHLVWRDNTTKFAIMGTNLNSCTDVTIAGILVTNPATKTNEYTVTNVTLAKNVVIAGIIVPKKSPEDVLGATYALAGIYGTNVILLGGPPKNINMTIAGILGTNVNLLAGMLGTNITRANIDRTNVTLLGIRGTNVTLAGILCDDWSTTVLGGILGTNSPLRSSIGKNLALPGFLETNAAFSTNIVTNKSVVIYASLPFPNQFSTMTNASNSIDFVVSGPEGRATKTLALPLEGKVIWDATISVSRGTNNRWTDIVIRNGQDLEGIQLLEALKAIMEKSEAPPKSTIIVP